MYKYCLDCGVEKSKKGYYCKKCGYKHRKRPIGLKYALKKINPTSFKKGCIPWNKNTKGLCKPNSGSFESGKHSSLKTEFKKREKVNENNINWRGDGVGYYALHTWIRRKLGKPIKCSFCNSTKLLVWANKSGNYLRALTDWISLCRACHGKYDVKTNIFGKASKKFPELRRQR